MKWSAWAALAAAMTSSSVASGAAVADVLHDRAVVEPGILQDHAEHAAQVAAGEIPDVVAVHQDGAAVDIVEAHQQLDHGGLAGAGWADDGDLLAGLGVERRNR